MRDVQRPGILSLVAPFAFNHPSVSAPPTVTVSPSAALDQPSPVVYPPPPVSPSLSVSPGGSGPSSFMSRFMSKLPHCAMQAPSPFVDQLTLAGALKQQHAEIAETSTTQTGTPTHTPTPHAPQQVTVSQSGADDNSSSAWSQYSHHPLHPSHPPYAQHPYLQQPHFHPYVNPYTRSVHPPLHHRGSLPLALSQTAPIAISPHPLSIGGPWQPVSRSIPFAHLNPAAGAPASFVPPTSSPVLSASALHRSQSDSVKLNHTYSHPPPRTSPLPNPPSPAYPSSSTASTSSSMSHSQLSASFSYDGVSLSPHPSPTGPLVRASSNPMADIRNEREAAAAATPVATSTAAVPAASQLAIDVNSLSVLSPAASPNSTLALSTPPAPSLSPASLSFVDRPMATWTADEVWTWLHQLNLGQYTLFHHRSIDGDMLLDMTDDDLRTEMGMEDKFHRGKLLKRIKEHTDKHMEAATAAAAASTGPATAASIVGGSVDDRKDKRERKLSRFQRYRSRASPHHAELTTQQSASPHIVSRLSHRPAAASSQPSLQPRDHHSMDGSSIDKYDYYVMQYEVMAALDDERVEQQQLQHDDGGRWEHKTSTPHHEAYQQHSHYAAFAPDALLSAQPTRRSAEYESEAVERAVDDAGGSWRSHPSRADTVDSPVSSSGSDDEAEEEEREQQRRERLRRRLHRRVSHDKHHHSLPAPHPPGNIHRSHSSALSTYWPALQPSTAALEHIDGQREISPQQQPPTHSAAATSAAGIVASSPSPPLPTTAVPLSDPAQPLAANLSMVSAAFASLTASSSVPASQGQQLTRHSAIATRSPASSSLYPPNQQQTLTVKPSLSADNLSSTLHATHSQQHSPLPLPLPSQHSVHSPQAPALSPLPHSQASSHQPLFPPHHLSAHSHPHSHTHSHPHPHPHHHASQSLPSPAPAPSPVPSRIDRLSSVLRSSPTFIDEVTNLTILSSGVAGHAYKGFFHSLPVVVKLPKTLEISGQEWREWQCHMRLPPHPNLVRFLGALVMQETNHLVMELIRQGSLKGVLAAGPAAGGLLGVYSSGYAVLRAALDIGRGLSHMHRHRLVHRDISSRNILVDDDGTFIIADLGLCREMNKHDSAAAGGAAVAGTAAGEGNDDSSDQYEMSRSTAIPVRWTSPEALLTSSYTSKSDVWALGVTLWEMTSGGAVPYQWVDGNRRLIQQLVDGTARLSVDPHWEPATDIGRRARRVIELCLRREVDERPNSAQLVELLEAEMEQWEQQAADEAQQHRDVWLAHHEQLQARWEAEATEAAEREAAKHQQLLDATVEAADSATHSQQQLQSSGSSSGSSSAAAAASTALLSPSPLLGVDEDEEEEERGLELLQPPQQRATSKQYRQQ